MLFLFIFCTLTLWIEFVCFHIDWYLFWSLYMKKMVSPLSVVCLDSMLKLNTMSAFNRYSKILLCLRFGSPNLHLLLHLPEVEHSLSWFFLYLISVFKSILKTLAPCFSLNYHGLFIIASADLYHIWAISLLGWSRFRTLCDRIYSLFLSVKNLYVYIVCVCASACRESCECN